MKQSSSLVVVISTLLFSFAKPGTKPDTGIEKTMPVHTSAVSWDKAPKKYRDAPTVSTNISGDKIVKTFGPYGNISGASFGIFPAAGSVIKAIGLSEDGSIVTNITIWYTNPSGNLVKSQAGKVSQAPMQFLEIGSEEYVMSISGKKDEYVTQLKIETNKGRRVTAGNGNTGTAFSEKVLPGFWLFGFWGYASPTRICQVNFNVHCKPWELLSGSDGKDIAVALDGTAYMVNTSGRMYNMPNGATSWNLMQGSDGRAIAANGSRVCMINTAGKIYELIGSTWKQLSGSDATDIAIASDNKIWITNSDGEIYRYKDDTKTWEQMPAIDPGPNMRMR